MKDGIESFNMRFFKRVTKFLLLPKGEGRDEGEERLTILRNGKSLNVRCCVFVK